MTCGDEHEFEFSISFAGADRAVAKDLATKLVEREMAVFYDEFHASRLLGARLDFEFRWVYGSGTQFFVPIVSSSYAQGVWPQFEWSIAQEEARRRKQFILPLRLDDTVLLGLPDTIGYLDLRNVSIDQVVEILAEKLRAAIGGGLRLRAPPHPETWVATFGLNVDELLSAGLLPDSAPTDYVSLCDWLEQDLLLRLRSPVRNARQTEASARNGETLSVRLAFEWVPREEALTFGDLGWWETLEVVPIEYIYGASSP
ncbi:MAG: hypothetical protein A2148_05980 [Chloroflexi bacterium RBG_16_68_14]|nr:MAG: hypothetical protein A2148_05980 [Chloroflexi bacterium RBG_16_68_14]